MTVPAPPPDPNRHYVLRVAPWGAVIEAARLGVAAYTLDIPASDTDDILHAECWVFVPVDQLPAWHSALDVFDRAPKGHG